MDGFWIFFKDLSKLVLSLSVLVRGGETKRNMGGVVVVVVYSFRIIR